MKVFQIDFYESERGWGSESWTETYKTFEDAKKRYDHIVATYGGQSVTPDYYIVPNGPIREVEVIEAADGSGYALKSDVIKPL